jgi:hypothetical protein
MRCVVTPSVACDFKSSLRGTGPTSEHPVDCAVRISSRTHIEGALYFLLGSRSSWHFFTFREKGHPQMVACLLACWRIIKASNCVAGHDLSQRRLT